jgi:hypothetical protein
MVHEPGTLRKLSQVKIYMLCQYDKLSQVREELVGGTHPKKINQKKWRMGR